MEVRLQECVFIRLLIHCSVISTATQATRHYNDENEDQVSANTVRWALKDIGFLLTACAVCGVQSNNEPKVKAADIDPKLVTLTVKHGGGSIMAWGCKTWDGPGYLAKIDSTLDSELNIRILQDELLNTVNW
ncbi:hypothetical protein BGZ80_006806 [Entomortierella chlamydospora]|uniref:Uncharacterized protein n=1 Tax=Entomortierella chlamydospora TaxID=101097 RepID=A0A9P6MFY0_9FUNG|nr:hypothetical protein BGZ80_006806 [Entomortierella chlamydospora]